VKLYDTLSGEKHEFAPWDGHTVRLYVCGVTPYDTAHTGHAMVYVFFDVVNRYCQYLGWRVKYVQNVTDIDDSIIERAQRDNEDWMELGQRQTRRLVEDLSALNVLWPSVFPRASEESEMIIKITSRLMDEGFAYASGGNVYFRVARDEDYGALSKYGVEEMIAISRERGADPDDPRKENPLDFILWQGRQPGEPYWESPWGPGRPGWHIECTAMSMRYLGDTIDIHGGGGDLIYPHHECEIAQAQHYSGKNPFTRFWMHVGMVRYQGEKMSKSLGNMVFVRSVLKHHTPDALRLYLLSNHYRTSWEYQDTGPAEFESVVSLLREATHISGGDGPAFDSTAYEQQFRAALDDDMDTPKAIQALNRLAGDIVRVAAHGNDVSGAQQQLRTLAEVLGLQGVR
jgi:L-cysteine:1D-myo-inositol 2-amino-2-deoxy-alpha-D-glucopyranoside ligase